MFTIACNCETFIPKIYIYFFCKSHFVMTGKIFSANPLPEDEAYFQRLPPADPDYADDTLVSNYFRINFFFFFLE